MGMYVLDSGMMAIKYTVPVTPLLGMHPPFSAVKNGFGLPPKFSDLDFIRVHLWLKKSFKTLFL